MHGPCSHLLEMRALAKLQAYFQISSQNPHHFFGVGLPHMAPNNNQNILQTNIPTPKLWTSLGLSHPHIMLMEIDPNK
jgi:hypothetical protein